MKMLFRCTALLIVLVAFVATGCRRVPPPMKQVNGPGEGSKGPADPIKSFLDNTRYPDNPRPGDDWTRYRDNFDQLAGYFTKPEVRTRTRLAADERAFLVSKAHLSEPELGELDASTFRSADAHYLDECFLLHDALKMLDVRGLSPTQQAEMDFDWVMRNVMLHEQGDTWVPPAFTLRRGYGNAVERAMVFLALLRQSRIEGCLIVVPESSPLQFVVGALGAKDNVLLFDTRLGQPLKGKDRKQALTLKDALANRTLLQPAHMDQAPKLEARLICPFYALAPRMLELQTQLSGYEAITLHLNAKALFDRLAETTTLPIEVWNPPAKGAAIPNSPTRCLPLFLPKDEGGLDPTKRAESWARSRIPLQNVEANLVPINVTKELLPSGVFGTFMGVANLFYDKYDLQVRELYLRGQFETIIRRQERLQAFARDDTLVGLSEDAQFKKEVGKWRERVRKEFAALGDPQTAAEAQMVIHEIAWPDEFMKWMLEGAVPIRAEHTDPHAIWISHLDKERPLEKDPAKERKKIKMMTKIQAVGMRDYFAHELARSQALAGHERAALAQASVDAVDKPTKAVLTRAHDGWSVARDSWYYYLERIGLSHTIDQRLIQLRTRLRSEGLEMLELRVGLLESLHLDVHKYFQARLSLGECKSHVEDNKKVRAFYSDLKSEIEDLRKKDPLAAEIKTLNDAVKTMPPELQAARAHFTKRLDLLNHDWTADGAYVWMLRTIEERTAALN